MNTFVACTSQKVRVNLMKSAPDNVTNFTITARRVSQCPPTLAGCSNAAHPSQCVSMQPPPPPPRRVYQCRPPFAGCFTFNAAPLLTGPREYCERESFEAQCNSNEAIVIRDARYGRMRIGRCTTLDRGSIGCSSDVLRHVAERCSGLRRCGFSVSSLHPEQEARVCPPDLMAYLEASYDCVAGESRLEESHINSLQFEKK